MVNLYVVAGALPSLEADCLTGVWILQDAGENYTISCPFLVGAHHKVAAQDVISRVASVMVWIAPAVSEQIAVVSRLWSPAFDHDFIEKIQ